MRVRVRLVGVLVVAWVLAVGGATAASAHTELRKTDPAVGETVKAAPRSVSFTFSGDMLALGAIVQVLGPDGAVEKGKPTVRGATVTQPLGAGVKNGSYIVSWRLTSNDGHVQSGTFTFLVADPARPRSTAGAGTPPADQEPPPPVETTAAVAGPAPSVNQTPGAAAQEQGEHDETGDLPLGWVIFGLVVLALVIAAAVITEVRRRRRRAGAPRDRSTG